MGLDGENVDLFPKSHSPGGLHSIPFPSRLALLGMTFSPFWRQDAHPIRLQPCRLQLDSRLERPIMIDEFRTV